MKNSYSNRYIVEFLRLLSEQRLDLSNDSKPKFVSLGHLQNVLKTAADRLEEATKNESVQKGRLNQGFVNSLPISKKTKEVLSKLSPVEEKTLLKNFGLLEWDLAY